MKVEELVAQLNGFDPKLEILCYSEDSGFRLLDIQGVSIVEGEKTRGDDQLPSLKLGKTDFSQKHVDIEVTSEF